MIRFFSAFAIIATLMTSQTSNFEVQEATIADIHRALASRRITCPQLVQKYLDRIDAYDKKGPAVNAIITVNSKALEDARSRRDHHRENQHGGIRMESGGDGWFYASGLHAQSVLAESRHSGFQRRHRCCSRIELCRRGARHRHRQFDSRTLFA